MDFTTLLSKAIESNNSEVIEFLMKDHDKVMELKEAINKKNVTVAEYFIADANYELPKEVITMLTTSWSDCFTLFSEKTNNELLCDMSSKGFIEEMKVMLSHRNLKINLDCKEGFPLRYASLNGHTEIVKMLLDECADVSIADYLCLENALVHNHLEIVKVLINQIKESDKLKVLTGKSTGYRYGSNEATKDYLNKCIEELTTPVKTQETQVEKVEVTVETVEVPKLETVVEDKVTVEEPVTVQEQLSIAIGTNPGTSSEAEPQLVFNVTQIEHIKTKPYFGIKSDTKLDVKFPCITEMESEDKWYYVYPLDGALLEKFNSVSVVFTQFGNKTPSFYTL